jgi:asparagine synthase (glutamine-hydrolysing)
MCGICGVFFTDRERRVDSDILARMNRQIVHRGPDDEGCFVDGNAGLAVRRLSVIDIRTGHQPISNEDGNIWIVFNGEIYNHQELRPKLEALGHRYRTRSDTETIVHLYEEYGPDCLQHLRGMFAFVLWDGRRRRLFAARDRLGIKPFYYHWEDRTFIFGSEVKAILAYPGVKAELNRGSLAEYLAFGYLSSSETMFAGIRKLLPGHTLQLDENGQLKIEPYWNLTIMPDADDRPKKYYVKTYHEMLEQCVSSHLMSDVPLGVFLSGGLDSGTIAALTARARNESLQTFSVGYDDDAYSELPYARMVAKHIGAEHHEVRLSREEFFAALPRLIWHEDEPIAWPSSVSLYFVAKLAQEHVKVVLTGEGADETLAGYARYAWTLLNSRLDRAYRSLMPAGLRRAARHVIANGPFSANLRRKLEHTVLGRDGCSWSSFYFDNFYAAFSSADQAELLQPGVREAAGDAYLSSMRYWEQSSGDLLHRLLYTDIKTYLVELLMKQDQMSMAASIESRVPFLDHELVEFTARIPARFLVKGLAGKQILKSAAGDLLPRAVIDRAKMGFPTPWSAWLNGAQVDEVERTLLGPRSQARGLLVTEAIKKIFAEHRTGHRDHADRIWRLLNLELWQRVFMDGEPLPGIETGMDRFVEGHGFSRAVGVPK